MFYIVLAGPDFGAGDLAARSRGQDDEGDRLRDLGHEAMAPVWEANHVWLIFVLTVLLDDVPGGVGSIASTLVSCRCSSPGLGIVVRGAAYALRAGTTDVGEARPDRHRERAVVGAHPVRAGRGARRDRVGAVPVGNAAGHW